jgi:predicted RNA binding protein YcfA (HicA-like mRNA interferase family)
VNRKKLLLKLSKGEVQNIAFRDLTNLVEGFGFNLDRISGSHHIYSHPAYPSWSICKMSKEKRNLIKSGNCSSSLNGII